MATLPPVGSVTPNPTTSTSTSPTSSGTPSNDTVTEQDFFQLLATELEDQNPTQPVDSTQFIGELAQFSDLSVQSQIQNELQTLVQLSQQQNAPILNGAALIGKSVVTAAGSGTVEAATVQNNAVSLAVNGLGMVPLASVTSILGTSLSNTTPSTTATPSTAPTTGS